MTVIHEVDKQFAEARRGIDVDLPLYVDDLDAVLVVGIELQIHRFLQRHASIIPAADPADLIRRQADAPAAHSTMPRGLGGRPPRGERAHARVTWGVPAVSTTPTHVYTRSRLEACRPSMTHFVTRCLMHSACRSAHLGRAAARPPSRLLPARRSSPATTASRLARLPSCAAARPRGGLLTSSACRREPARAPRGPAGSRPGWSPRSVRSG